MKKFLCAAVCTVAMVGFVVADEFTASITKTDGKTVTYFKTEKGKGGKGGGKKGGGATKIGDAITTPVSAKVTVKAGKFDKDAGKLVVEDVKGGLTADNFKMIDADKGLNCTITIADDGADKGKITSIVLGGGKGKKGGGGQ